MAIRLNCNYCKRNPFPAHAWISTFYAKQGLPHTFPLLMDQNEVCDRSVPHKFLIFHAKWGSPHIFLSLKGKTRSVIILLHMGFWLSTQREVYSTPSTVYGAKWCLKLFCSTWIFDFPREAIVTPHLPLLTERNEVCNCSAPHKFATFHAKRGPTPSVYRAKQDL